VREFTDILSGIVVQRTDPCVCVCIYSQESDIMHSESEKIVWKPHFALFNPLYGDYTKRNVKRSASIVPLFSFIN